MDIPAYRQFQETIFLQKRLLLYFDVDRVDIRTGSFSRSRRECQNETLRLWETEGRGRSILFFANARVRGRPEDHEIFCR
jgi:hypothetical protein